MRIAVVAAIVFIAFAAFSMSTSNGSVAQAAGPCDGANPPSWCHNNDPCKDKNTSTECHHDNPCRDNDSRTECHRPCTTNDQRPQCRVANPCVMPLVFVAGQGCVCPPLAGLAGFGLNGYGGYGVGGIYGANTFGACNSAPPVICGPGTQLAAGPVVPYNYNLGLPGTYGYNGIYGVNPLIGAAQCVAIAAPVVAPQVITVQAPPVTVQAPVAAPVVAPSFAPTVNVPSFDRGNFVRPPNTGDGGLVSN